MSDQSHPHLTFPDGSNQTAAEPQSQPPASPAELPSPAAALGDDAPANVDAVPAAAKKNFLTTYVAGWAALAVLAVAYLGTVAIYPDLLRGPDPGTMMTEPEPNKGQRAVASAPAKASTSPTVAITNTASPARKEAPEEQARTEPKLADTTTTERTGSLPQFRHETAAQAPITHTAAEPSQVRTIEHETVITTADMIAGLQSDTDSQTNSIAEATTNTQVAASSTGPGPAPVVPKLISSAKPGNNDQSASKDADGAKASGETKQVAEVTPPPLPALKPKLRASKLAAEARRKVAEKQAAARRDALEAARLQSKKAALTQRSGPPIVTGSIAQNITAPDNEPISFGEAVITPAPTRIGVRLATGPTIDALRLSWDLLRTKHGATLNGLQPRYTVTEAAGGRRFGLVAGPLKTSDDARRVCLQMQASHVSCTPSTFTGNSL